MALGADLSGLTARMTSNWIPRNYSRVAVAVVFALAITGCGGPMKGGSQVPEGSSTGIQVSLATDVFGPGDVFVAAVMGKIQWRHPDGSLVRVLDTGAKAYPTGMAFDARGNLYVTNFNAGTISEFDSKGYLVGTVGSNYNCDPESIAFDGKGNAFVGQADCGKEVLEFDPNWQFLKSFKVSTDDRGSDWVELAADQCTLYYTSEGKAVKRFNVCTNSQMADFTSHASGDAFALRLLPDGGLLLAEDQQIVRFNAGGRVIQSYQDRGENSFFALNIDPDGKSFWSAGDKSGNVFKFDVATGKQLLKFNVGSEVGGLAVYREKTAGMEPSHFSPILFAFNCSDLTPDANAALSEMKIYIDRHPGTELIVEGHADDIGGQDYNLRLSQQRAQSVANWLELHGVRKNLIKVRAYGKGHPIVANTSDENRKRNRCVQIVEV
jgi:outer membrane protein OmpA-like peptidoglycan-associated protein